MRIPLIAENLESTLDHCVGTQHAAKTSPVESVISSFGSYCSSLAYTGFFFPHVRIVDGIPFAKFSATAQETPIDCVHVDMLHHSQAEGRTPEIIDALGVALASIWSINLQLNNVPGCFKYDKAVGSDVVYLP